MMLYMNCHLCKMKKHNMLADVDERVDERFKLADKMWNEMGFTRSQMFGENV